MKRFCSWIITVCLLVSFAASAEVDQPLVEKSSAYSNDDATVVLIISDKGTPLYEEPLATSEVLIEIPVGSTATCYDFTDDSGFGDFFNVEYRGFIGYVTSNNVYRYSQTLADAFSNRGGSDANDGANNNANNNNGYNNNNNYNNYNNYNNNGYNDYDDYSQYTGRYVYLTGDVNIRSGPGLGYRAISSASAGRSLSYMGNTQYDDRGVAWYKVSSRNGYGWVSSRYSRLGYGSTPYNDYGYDDNDDDYDYGSGDTASTYIYNSTSALKNNIDRAISALNGEYVSSGGYFSFNSTVGSRTKNDGYQVAENGRGVQAIAGGVSQVASTLYLALKKRGSISYTEKKTYGDKYAGSYVSSSSDAIVTDYANNIDFSFRNKGSAFSISIWRDGNTIYCKLS